MESSSPHPPVIVGWDGSERCHDALELGERVARARGAPLVVVHSYPAFPYAIPDEYERALRHEADERLRAVPVDSLADVEVELRAIAGRSPAATLHDAAERLGAQCVVVGSTRRGPIGQVLPGSTAEELLNGSPCAVLVAPRGYAHAPERPLRTIAVAFDGSPEADAALSEASALAADIDAGLRLVAVLEPAGIGHSGVTGGELSHALSLLRTGYLERSLREAVEAQPDSVRADGELLTGEAADEIVRATGTDTDLLVMGSRAYGPLSRALLGSVSRRVVRMSRVPVLVVPRSAAGPGARSVETTERVQSDPRMRVAGGDVP